MGSRYASDMFKERQKLRKTCKWVIFKNVAVKTKKSFLRNLWENLHWEMIFFTFIFIKFCKKFRSSYQRYSIKKPVLKHFAIFRGKHLCWCFFSIKSQNWRPTSANNCFYKFQISDIPRESCFTFQIKCLNFWSMVDIYSQFWELCHSWELNLLCWVSGSRSSRPDVFSKKGGFITFAKFTGKHLCQVSFLIKFF